MSIRSLALAATSALALGVGAAQAAPVPVALELALVIDVSNSINTSEYNLQRQGYAAAFNNATVQANILSFAAQGGVAVAVYQFASNAMQAIGWTQLTTLSDITNFATAIGTMARASNLGAAQGGIGTQTDVEDGMLIARNGINSNNFAGARRVIDVSGDGFQNVDEPCTVAGPTYSQACGPTRNQRNGAQNDGVTINGLAVEGALGLNGVTNWYTSNVITADGFVITAANNDDFQRAVVEKIGREIIGVPEPMSLALFGMGLAGLGMAARRRRS